MDIAVNLVESYLRLNGYLTLSEFEVQKKNPSGVFETITDVDIVGIRFPGEIYAADAHEDCHLLLIEDEVLQLEERLIDVVIGEVKEGQAVFNPAIKRHEVIHSVLRRVGWVFDEPLEPIVDEVMAAGLAVRPGRSGAAVRVRLVAFGRSPRNDLHVISLTHIFETMVRFMEDFDDVLRPARFKDPAPGLIRLLVKTGFEIAKR